LAKLKFFQRKKTKEEAHIQEKATREEIQDSEEKHIESELKEKTKEAPIKEYNETLYSKGFEQKQQTTSSFQQKPLTRRTTWENAETIEQNIDKLRLNQSGSTSDCTKKGIDTEKKVDFILLKKKK
jgi:hypothetical protein